MEAVVATLPAIAAESGFNMPCRITYSYLPLLQGFDQTRLDVRELSQRIVGSDSSERKMNFTLYGTFNFLFVVFLVYAILLRVIFTFPNRNRTISTSQLKRLLVLHLTPINVIISYGSQTIPNLEAGFPLRCFQRLSIPDIATEQSGWRQSSYTRGQFTPVLSY